MPVSTLSPRLERWFVDYADSHRHPVNQLTHKVAIPLIVFHILAMATWVPLGFDVAGHVVTLAHLLYVAAIGFYLTLHVPLALVMAVLFALCFPLAAITPRPVVVAVAVIGWVVQLAGHAVWEKNRPAFLTNLLQALIGPLFFVAILGGIWRPSRTTLSPAQ
ncbi:MAG TPA: Mpo1-like protein [Myxococcota bacterium]